MASAKFLEEALSTDVDESAVSAIVGSLENQLVTSASHVSNQSNSNVVLNQNHVNSAISNGGTVLGPQQKHGTIANGDSINTVSVADASKQVTNNAMIISSASAQSVGPAGVVTSNFNASSVQHQGQEGPKTSDGVKIVYSQGSQGAAAVIPNRVQMPVQTLPNGSIGLQPQQMLPVTTANVQPMQQNKQQQQSTIVIKTSGAPTGAPGLVTVPMNVTSSVPPTNNQLTLQSIHGLQPGQQGHLLLKTENGQYQLLRVGPAPPGNIPGGQPAPGQNVTFRMQTVPTTTSNAGPAPVQAGGTTTVSTATPTVAAAQRPANDNTKEKCRKFLANLLELSSREPKSVERNVRTLIQELIDMKVEPEDFCDKLERLLNASPQPCLIGFLKKSLPLLRHSLATKELSIDGIRPPPTNVVFSIQSGSTPTVQSQIRPGGVTNQVRIVAPGTTVVRPNQVLQQRLVTPIRAPIQQGARMVTTIRQPGGSGNNVIVSNSQPPALHPVFSGNQSRPVRHPVQVRAVQPGQVRQPVAVRNQMPVKVQSVKPAVPSSASRPTTKDKEKKTFSSAYTGDDDINDVAAMGGVNLAEETQKILGSTEFVGTQIRSCKEDVLCSMGPLQQKIRKIMIKHGLDEPGPEVAACISHAAEERLKNLVEKLAIITEHRLDIIKSDNRYEVTNDVKSQLKFLEDLDRAERKRHEELERELLMKAARSRSKTEDPEQAKLKAKAKEMQRVEMEELRQREANATALQAIGPRKKPRLDGDPMSNPSQSGSSNVNSGSRGQLPLRQRMKKVTLRDLQFLFETEKDLCRSKLLYKSYLK